MKSLLLLVVCVAAASAFPSPRAVAERCTAANCKLADGCACASSESPLGNTANTPQLVTVTFDDSLRTDVYQLIERLLFNRTNPDGSAATATVYLPHSYTDYQRVNALYNKGYDIGVNSISKGTANYFQTASNSLLTDEFSGQRQIVANFANIPAADIKGVRTPHFELAGNNTFNAYSKSGLKFDNSWTTRSDAPVFPYTLDYKSDQQCLVGKCPTESYPGIWVAPIVNFIGQDNQQCNVLFACQVSGTAVNIRDWLIQQYERSHSGPQVTKVPLSFLVNAGWFQTVENSLEGLELFLDYLGTQKDTFLVSHSEVIRWAGNPVAIADYKPVVQTRNQRCIPATCVLPFGDSEMMYMGSCARCPEVYPWVGNPEGIA